MTKKNSLLIVDDDAANLMELTHIFRAEYKVYVVKDGKAALEKATESLPDLILLDVIMPDMNGFDVLRELKKSEKTKDIPVIFITGMNDNENEGEGLSIGAVDYIRKPFNTTVVKIRVRNQIEIVKLKRGNLASNN
ncbi:MAG: response regulator [Defluviitaleaceae bacterium]|nr:response regulator [Defluviitaleaceae bacterium]